MELVAAQLPADLPQFSGRADELRQLDRRLGTAARAGGVAAVVVVAAVAGTAGVGKTALAVHWALYLPRMASVQVVDLFLTGDPDLGLIEDVAHAHRRR